MELSVMRHVLLTVTKNFLLSVALKALSHYTLSINQSKRIYIAPYVAGESEARVGLG